MCAKIVFALAFVFLARIESSLEFGLSPFYAASDPFNFPATPLPFPTCRAIDVDCQRRGLRTFFFLMDAGHLGMRPIDPVTVNSVTVSYVEEQVTLRMSRLNVTGARWTRLLERRFNLQGNRSGVRFQNDFHVTGWAQLKLAERYDPLTAFITMDIQDVESNITYKWAGQRGIDNEDYILIGQERVAVRNLRIPTYFLISDNQDAYIINEAMRSRPALIDEISNEIVTSVMHNIVDNFRLFAYNVPVKYYYQYY